MRRLRSLPRFWLSMRAALAAAVATAPLGAAVEGYRFVIPTVDAKPGDATTITVQGEHERSAQGFLFAARYAPASLTIDRIHATDTILEAIGADFVLSLVDRSAGTLIVSALVETLPPFSGDLIPNIGMPLDLFYIEARVSPEARGDIEIRLEDGLGLPPVQNSYTVDNLTKRLTSLDKGIVRLPADPQPIVGPAFIRGDATSDVAVDIADPVRILRHIFSGYEAPPCQLAADANDDDKIDISDPIYLLEFLFSKGTPPPPPFAQPGADPSAGRLGCAQPLFVVE